jgi:hypothetical protein
MTSQRIEIDLSDRHRRRRRRLIALSVSSIASLLLALLGEYRSASASPPPANRRRSFSAKDGATARTIRSIREGGGGYDGAFLHPARAGYGGVIIGPGGSIPSRAVRLAPPPRPTTGRTGATLVRAGRRSGGGGSGGRIDEQREDFQRSLLEAKIANDIKNAIVKDEKHRNMAVAKRIGQEKVELKDAVQEVKEAAQVVSQSAKSLGGAVIGSASAVEAAREVSKSAMNLGGAVFGMSPMIFKRLVTLCATSETR